MKATTVDISEFQYVVISTGYTSRLAVGKRHDKLLKKMTDIFELEDADRDDVQDSEKRLIYIEDTIWGGGLTSFQDEESDKVRSLLGEDKDGVICFRASGLNRVMELVEALTDISYCGCMGFGSLTSMKLISNEQIKVLYMDFDCESG